DAADGDAVRARSEQLSHVTVFSRPPDVRPRQKRKERSIQRSRVSQPNLKIDLLQIADVQLRI
ncbi:MAG TPA: hypothetical protein VHA77_01565, partial [Xanthobacteraceae bacterium]|nr:hypothetical protein [Xanthobacteraceae bacterium]